MLIGFMAGFLALLGHLIWGPAGVLQLLFVGIVFALVQPLALALVGAAPVPGLPEPSWLRTHPPTEKRIRRLLALAPPAQPWLPGWHPVRPHGMPAVASLTARPRYHVSGLWY